DYQTVTIAWGDGWPNTVLNLAAGVLNFTASHTYVDIASSVSVTVADKDGGTGTASTPITVLNVAPNVLTDSLHLSALNILEGGSVTLTGAFTDPGLLEAHTVLVVWADGTSSYANVDEQTQTFSAD